MGARAMVGEGRESSFLLKPASLSNKLKIRWEARYLSRKCAPISSNENNNLLLISLKR